MGAHLTTTSAAFSPGGQFVLALTLQGRLLVWQLTNMAIVLDLEAPQITTRTAPIHSGGVVFTVEEEDQDATAGRAITQAAWWSNGEIVLGLSDGCVVVVALRAVTSPQGAVVDALDPTPCGFRRPKVSASVRGQFFLVVDSIDNDEFIVSRVKRLSVKSLCRTTAEARSKAKWLGLVAVTTDAVEGILANVQDDLWVIRECCARVPHSKFTAEALLVLALNRLARALASDTVHNSLLNDYAERVERYQRRLQTMTEIRIAERCCAVMCCAVLCVPCLPAGLRARERCCCCVCARAQKFIIRCGTVRLVP